MNQYFESNGIKKITSLRKLAIDKDSISKFKQTVDLFGVGKWSKIQQHLAVHHNIHLPNVHLDYFWNKINQEEQSEEFRRNLRIQIAIDVMENNFNIEKCKFHQGIIVAEYAKQTQDLTRRVCSTMIRVFVRQKIKYRMYFASYTTCRYSIFGLYLHMIDMVSNDALVQSMQQYASKFKEIAIMIFKQCLNKKRTEIYGCLKSITNRRQCEIIMDHLLYMSEILKVQDGSITKNEQINRVSNICPSTIEEIRSSEVYKITMKPNKDANIKMFEIYSQHQKDSMEEDKNNQKYSINPFAEKSIPSKINSSLQFQRMKKPSLKQLLPHRRTLQFTLGVEQELLEQEKEDSLEELSASQIEDILPIKQKSKKHIYQIAIKENKTFKEFAKLKLKEHMDQVCQEYTKIHGSL